MKPALTNCCVGTKTRSLIRVMRRLHRRSLFPLAFLVVLMGGKPADARCGSGNLPLQVKIFGDSHVGLNKPVALNIVVENTGGDTLRLPTPMEPDWYWLRFEVTDPWGKAVEWRGPEIKLIYSEKARISLDSGYSYGRYFRNLERDLDFSRPGKYAIRANWGIGPDARYKWGKYTSRAFILHVSP